MQTFLERYRRGEHPEVWTHLLALGEGVRAHPVIGDAMEVAREFVRRAWHNAEVVHGRLLELGYKFESGEKALTSAAPDATRIVAQIEQEIGVLPLSVKAWYEVFGSIDFSQHASQRFAPGHSPVCGLGENCQLVMHDPKSVLDDWSIRCKDFRNPSEQTLLFWGSIGRKPEGVDRTVRTGGVATSCDPIEIELPELRADGFVDLGMGKIGFVAQMRESFRWGGFPYCRLLLEGKWNLGAVLARPDAERIFPLLKADLLPL